MSEWVRPCHITPGMPRSFGILRPIWARKDREIQQGARKESGVSETTPYMSGIDRMFEKRALFGIFGRENAGISDATPIVGGA